MKTSSPGLRNCTRGLSFSSAPSPGSIRESLRQHRPPPCRILRSDFPISLFIECTAWAGAQPAIEILPGFLAYTGVSRFFTLSAPIQDQVSVLRRSSWQWFWEGKAEWKGMGRGNAGSWVGKSCFCTTKKLEEGWSECPMQCETWRGRRDMIIWFYALSFTLTTDCPDIPLIEIFYLLTTVTFI